MGNTSLEPVHTDIPHIRLRVSKEPAILHDGHFYVFLVQDARTLFEDTTHHSLYSGFSIENDWLM